MRGSRSFLLIIFLLSGLVTNTQAESEFDPHSHAMSAATDQRWPLKLLPMMAAHQKEMMRSHLVAVQKIIAATAVHDFDGISRAAHSMGYSEQTAAMCSNMGAATPGFTERAIQFHLSADAITAAADNKNMDGVMTALGKTLAHCTGCHAMYRQEVVDQTTWQQLQEHTANPP